MGKGSKTVGAFVERVATALGMDAKKEASSVTKLINEQRWTEKNFGSKIGKYRAEQAKKVGAANKTIAEKRMADIPDPNPSPEVRRLQQEGIKERNLSGGDYTGAEYNDLASSVEDDIRYNKVSAPGTYAKEYEAKLAAEHEKAAQKAREYEDKLIDDFRAKTTSNTNQELTLSFEKPANDNTFGTGFSPVQSKGKQIIFNNSTEYGIPGLYTPETGGQKIGQYVAGSTRAMPTNAEVDKAIDQLTPVVKTGDKYTIVPRNKTSTPIKTKAPEPPINENTAWGSTAKAVLGTAVVGAGICAALSSSRGQQNNAQLYGQQPLY